MNMNDKNQLVHIQGENSYNYTVIYHFINNKKIVNVDKYLEVNFTYTEEATMLIQITNGDTMSVEVGQIASTYNRIVNFYLFWTE